MAGKIVFNGFHKECPKFFKDLKSHNTKKWFNAHKEDYEKFVMTPARDFVVAMGERLKKSIPRINADPRVNKSLFRIQRDTRFSRDKTPYKTNLGIWIWEGYLPRMECSGFYFHLEDGKLMLGGGIYIFPQSHMEPYRKSVVDKKYGQSLVKAIQKVSKNKNFEIGGRHYKRVPRGFDPNHPNAELLLYNGLFASYETSIPKEFYKPDLVDYCYERYKKMMPIHQWLTSLIERI